MGSVSSNLPRMRFVAGSILVVCSIAVATGLPQFDTLKKVKDGIGSFSTRLKCGELPNDGTCAVLFDEDDCSGWSLSVKEGYTKLPSQSLSDLALGTFIDNPKGDDAEAVLVRNGCTLIAYDRPKDALLGKGDTAVIAATRGDRYVNLAKNDEFKDLNEEIEAVDCTCTGLAGR